MESVGSIVLMIGVPVVDTRAKSGTKQRLTLTIRTGNLLTVKSADRRWMVAVFVAIPPVAQVLILALTGINRSILTHPEPVVYGSGWVNFLHTIAKIG